MNDLVQAIQGVFDQQDPLNPRNMALFFAWVAIFAFTFVGLWRSRRAWLRFFSFAINQCVTFGVVLSWSVTSLIAVAYWWQSLIFAALTGVVAWLLFDDG